MQLLFMLLFFAVTSGVFIFISSFPYKKQSFLLGVSGAVGGGVIALIWQHGLSSEVAQTMLFLLLAESGLLFLLDRTWKFR